MPNRYTKSTVVINRSENYQDVFDNKNLSSIKQYLTYDFRKLRDIDKYNFSYISHKIEPYERLENIAYRYYGDTQYWWIICYTNKISNPLQLTIGQPIRIYLPLENILELL